MTAAGLVIRSLRRARLRAAFTICATATAVAAFVLLQTIHDSWSIRGDHQPPERLVTQDAISYAVLLPRRYVDDAAKLPHVRHITYMNWLGGRMPSRPSEYFGAWAVDERGFFDVYDEIVLSAEAKALWREKRNAALVGDVLAAKLGLQVGDRISLESGLYPEQAEWRFEIAGIYATQGKSASRSNLYVRWDYFNELAGEWHNDSVGWIVAQADDPRRSPELAASIDARFADSGQQTFTQSETAFHAAMGEGMSAVMDGLMLACAGVLLIVAVLIGNTIAMGVRERMKEYGTLRALGFMPAQLAVFVLAEAALLGGLGGALGLGAASALIDGGIRRWVEAHVDSFLPYFGVGVGTTLLAVLAPMLAASLAAAIPAYRVFRLRVVDTLRLTA
jgi:putative ABC transport system permease protein